ncbi:hypothetical protein LTS08_006823 [Lithohypha guttulata]|uniref:Uncharacterized protein n=1 Tax=Lithohypha guttulata TaxID=1690604 RepID=A0AAN7YKH1_9EURO|nr:hypothetical protein LTR05_000563 [Lithohypha guttulata]KAK5097411.1 hypothetical protein LTS08_006823 [Lithohypha guttulata]
MNPLTQLDSLEIRVLINDQLDNIAPSWHPEVHAPGRFAHIRLAELDETAAKARGDAQLELRLPNSCCGAHGLSLMITATAGDVQHTLLFDAGPEGEIWEKNVERLGLVNEIGGLQRAIEMINKAKSKSTSPTNVTMDLHPNRPFYRGMVTPAGPISLEADPTFTELEAAGATVTKNAQGHNILDDMFFVSGQIPRTTLYETGISGGIRLDDSDAGWQADPLILDERFVMCNLRGKGLVVFTGCSHAGVVNVSRHAVEVGGGVPLYAVAGGFHLSDAQLDKVQETTNDLAKLDPKVLMPGHCSGWRVQVEAERIMPGRVVPIYAGQKYGLSALL